MRIILLCFVYISALSSMEKEEKISVDPSAPASSGATIASRKKTKTERLARLLARYGQKGLARKIAEQGPECPTNYFFRANLTKNPQKRRELEEKGSKSPVPSQTGKMLAQKNFERFIAEAHTEWQNAYRMQKVSAPDSAIALENYQRLIAAASDQYRDKRRFDDNGHQLSQTELDQLVARKINKLLYRWHLERAKDEWSTSNYDSCDDELEVFDAMQLFYGNYLQASGSSMPLAGINKEVASFVYQTLYEWNLERAKTHWLRVLEKGSSGGDSDGDEDDHFKRALWFYVKNKKHDQPHLEDSEIDDLVELHFYEIIYLWQLEAAKDKVLMANFTFDQTSDYIAFLKSKSCEDLFIQAKLAYKRYIEVKYPENEEDEINEHIEKEFKAIIGTLISQQHSNQGPLS